MDTKTTFNTLNQVSANLFWKGSDRSLHGPDSKLEDIYTGNSTHRATAIINNNKVQIFLSLLGS